jgi:xanthine dehydrogenase accessory factor
MKNIYLKMLKMVPAITNPVLATVAGTVGSTPQKPGSSALFGRDGLITGTVGGGIVEGKVQELAKVCGGTKESGYFHYQLDKDISQREEAICGGRISVIVDADPMKHVSVFNEIAKSLSAREPGVLITKVTGAGEKVVKIERFWMTGKSKPALPAAILEKIEPEIICLLASGGSDPFKKIEIKVPGESLSTDFYLEPVFPLPKLVIAGAGHIGKALSHLGKMLDFEVIMIDDRQEFANPGNLPDADHIIVKEIGGAMHEIEKATDTYIVIVTRGHKDDGEALKPCIGSEAAYVGMIGSKGKVAKMKAEFIQNGWATEEQWSRIFTPIGLNIKSITVEEIAVSIAAQLVLVKNGLRLPASGNRQPVENRTPHTARRPPDISNPQK